MNIVNKLTIRHLRLNRGRTFMTIMGIVLSVAMVCAVSGFVLSLQDMLRRTIIENKGDYHIVFVDVTPEIAKSIANEDVFSTHFTKSGDTEGLTNIYLRLSNPGRDFLDAAREVAQRYDVETWGANSELLALEGFIAQDNVIVTFIAIAVIAIAVVVTGSIIVIANAFYISASERVRQFGLLKSAGATKGQICRSILFEAFILAAVAIPLGILIGFLVQAVVLYFTNDLLRELSAMNNSDFSFHVVFKPVIVYISVAVAALTVLISAWLPARRAAKTSPIDAIRQTKDIRIRPKQLKTSRLTQTLFGFEGTLAAKSLKRSRGKYRATVISLTVSVVLFVSMSSLVWIMNKDAQMQYGGYDFDVLITVTGEMDIREKVDPILTSVPDAEITRYQRITAEYEISEDFFTEKAKEYAEASGAPLAWRVILTEIPDDLFAKFAPVTRDKMTGILVNTTGTVRLDNKLAEYAPYNFSPGIELPVGYMETGGPVFLDTVTLVAETANIPEAIPAALFRGEYINVLIPESVFREHALGELGKYCGVYTAYAVTTSNPEAFIGRAGELTEQYSDYVSMSDISQLTRMNRNIVLIIMLFGYGFIAMLSLIAITSVISTISTNMALRTQEFAMLYSAGMTSGGMKKMLNLESLLYGLKSLAIGLPLGAALSYALYKSMASTVEFAYELPWFSMAISIIAIMLLTFGTMRYSKGKLNKVSIVEAIRSETS